MALLNIPQEDVAEYHGDLVPTEARLYASKNFRTAEGVWVLGGSPERDPDYYQNFTASLVGSMIRIAAGTAYSTTDAAVGDDVTYRLVVVDAEGTIVREIYNNLRIPPDVDPVTWNQIHLVSQGRVLSSPPTYLDSATILALIVTGGASELITWAMIGGAISGSSALQAALEARVPASRILRINGVAHDLSTDRDWYVPSGEPGGGSFDPNALYALAFDHTKNHHVFCGEAYTEDEDLGSGFVEFVYKPKAGGQYLLSVDEGGAHAWLVGLATGLTQAGITGNISTMQPDGDYELVSFAAEDNIDIDTWHHFAVLVDQPNNKIYVYTDGVASFPATIPAGNVRRLVNPQNGEIMIGGSHHLNASGELMQMGIYEGDYPTSESIPPLAFRPSRHFGFPTRTFAGVLQGPNMLWNFTAPTGRIVPDIGDGYNGIKHNGVLHSDQDAAGLYGASYGGLIHSTSELPQWVEVTDFEKPPYTGSVTPTPVGAIVFDAFERADVVPFWDQGPDNVLGLGTAPTGHEWQNSDKYGIIDKHAYFSDNTGTVTNTWVDAETSNLDIRLTRKNLNGPPPAIPFRYVDENNLFVVYHGGIGTLYIEKRVAGVWTGVTSAIVPNTYLELKVVTDGNNIKIYTDGALAVDINDAALTTATRSGIRASGHTRIKKFEVYPA